MAFTIYTTCLLIVHLLGGVLSVDCWFFPEWNQWDFSWGRTETDTPVRVESESNLRYFTVLNVMSVVFCKLLVFVKYSYWPLTYFSPHGPRKGHRVWDWHTPVESKVKTTYFHHPVFALSQFQCSFHDRREFLLRRNAMLRIRAAQECSKVATSEHPNVPKLLRN